MRRLITKYRRLLRVISVVLVLATLFVGLVWYYSPGSNYEPLITMLGALTALIGVPTLNDFSAGFESSIDIHSIGDKAHSRPEVLCIGLAKGKRTCFVSLPITIKNTGNAPVKNLAVRVELPSTFAPDLPTVTREIENQTMHFESSPIDSQYTQLSYFVPALRVDESVTIEVGMQIRPENWIMVKAGGHQLKQSGLALSKLGSQTPIQLIETPLNITALADNVRAVNRRLELWVTPSESFAELQQKFPDLATVALIWKRRYRAYIFPVFRSLVYNHPLWNRMRRAALWQFSLRPILTHAIDLFEPGSQFVPAQFGSFLLANPAPNYQDFWRWVKEVYSSRPFYYP